MFLDISFIGAANYRKDGYSKIYKSLRKHRKQGGYDLDSTFTVDMEHREIYDLNHNSIHGSNLNLTLPHLSGDVSDRYASLKKAIRWNMKAYKRKVGLTEKQLHENRMYEKHNPKKCSFSVLNKVSLGSE